MSKILQKYKDLYWDDQPVKDAVLAIIAIMFIYVFALVTGIGETVHNLLHDHAEILDRDDGEQGVRVLVSIDPAELSKFTSRFGCQAQN